jgi:hypothetical protein
MLGSIMHVMIIGKIGMFFLCFSLSPRAHSQGSNTPFQLVTTMPPRILHAYRDIVGFARSMCSLHAKFDCLTATRGSKPGYCARRTSQLECRSDLSPGKLRRVSDRYFALIDLSCVPLSAHNLAVLITIGDSASTL